ncbi:hypothetical protein Bbelb_343160 [Branchiostoma belcheri]|nr:hypothetical protein Bbelb_343160 [Branchiostoma belcheri]
MTHFDAVEWFKKQIPRKRYLRAVPNFNDAEWNKQSYLHSGQINMNVLPAWQQSYHGEGILVGVVDDGVFKNHPDLASRVNHGSSHNFVSVQGSAWPWSPWSDPNDPTPSSESESHGTRCAGIIAAQENNNICGVGVAYRAEIAASVTTRRTCFCVLSTCKNVGKRKASVRGEYRLRTESYGFGSTQTRRRTLSACKTFSACVLRIRHPYRASTGDVRAPYVPNVRNTREYASLWLSGNRTKIVRYKNVQLTTCTTKDARNRPRPDVACRPHSYTLRNRARLRLFGNPNGFTEEEEASALTHNLQNIHIYSNSWGPNDYSNEITGPGDLVSPALNHGVTFVRIHCAYDGYINSIYTIGINSVLSNGQVAGFFHDKCGFGLINTADLVERAKTWQSVPQPALVCEVSSDNVLDIPFDGQTVSALHISSGSCGIRYLEHVLVAANIGFPRRGHLRLTLAAPSGTASTVAPGRDRDETPDLSWTFLTLQNWGENPLGSWRLSVRNTHPETYNSTGYCEDNENKTTANISAVTGRFDGGPSPSMVAPHCLFIRSAGVETCSYQNYFKTKMY